METVNISPSLFTAKGKPVEIKESAKPFKNAPGWANYYVRQLNGDIVFYEHTPEIEWQHYFCNTGQQLAVEDKTHSGYNPAWRKSIRKRPTNKVE
jgi:hypothetical protein